MNKQIKELAVEAKLPGYVLEYGTELCLAPHLEKFAELIIRECITHVRDTAMRAGGACTIVGEEGLWLAKDMEKRFGIDQ